MKLSVKFISIILINISLIRNSDASNDNELKKELRSIYQEIGSIKDVNHNQNMEIALLKEIISKELYNQAHNDNHSSNKRPARLLPPWILHGDRRNKSHVIDSSLFYGPPTNCSDLTKLGYTLNGFYLVKSPKITNDSTAKIETTYCSFKKPKDFSGSLTESREGLSTAPHPYMTENIKSEKSRGVHFYASRLRDIKVAKHSPFTFDGLSFNFGDGFNESSGVFKAPRSGLYQLNFKGWISWVLNHTKRGMPSITTHLNDHFFSLSRFPLYSPSNNYSNEEYMYAPSSKHNNREPTNVVIQITVLLKLGDRIHLTPEMECTMKADSTNSFSGSLLEEVEDVIKSKVKKA